jgi:hypothetical protein
MGSALPLPLYSNPNPNPNQNPNPNPNQNPNPNPNPNLNRNQNHNHNPNPHPNEPDYPNQVHALRAENGGLAAQVDEMREGILAMQARSTYYGLRLLTMALLTLALLTMASERASYQCRSALLSNHGYS